MRKSMMMAAVMVAFLFTMGSVLGQCEGKSKTLAKGKTIQCSIKKGRNKCCMKKMMTNCPMMKNMSDAEKKTMMSKCPMMKFMMSTDKNKKPRPKSKWRR